MTQKSQVYNHGQGKSWQNERKEDGTMSRSWSLLAKPDISKEDSRPVPGGRFTATSAHLGEISSGADLFMAPLVDYCKSCGSYNNL